jgi:hypothetical protein
MVVIKAPFQMIRGAAVVNGDVAHFKFMNCDGEVCSYTI